MSLLQLLLLSVLLAHAQCQNSSSRAPEVCLNLSPSPDLEKFVDELPDMPVISLSDFPSITIGAYKITQVYAPHPPTTLYAFGASQETAVYPGPTLVAQQGQAAAVRWENHIPDYEHMLPVDRSLRWANPRRGYVPMTVHNHGQETEGWSDGHPNAWFTKTGEHGSTYVTQNYVYPNNQLPTMLWYHDHTFGITRLNIAAGMVGAYLITSPNMEPAWVPKSYRVLVVQDKAFYDDGEIKYPTVGFNPPVHPNWCVEYLGDVMLVNGKVWPYMEVGRATYRFRTVNAANTRTMIFSLDDERLSFVKIGVDQGYLRTPTKQKRMRLAVAERVDWLLDFSDCDYGDEIRLMNVGPAPFPAGPPANQPVLLFRVVQNPADPGSSVSVPYSLTPEDLEELNPVEIIQTTTGKDLSDVDWNNVYNRPLRQTVGWDSGHSVVTLFQDDTLHFDDPATEVIKLYSSEVWCFINLMDVGHSMHTHLVSFHVLEEQPFDVNRVNNQTCSFEFNFPDPRSCYSGSPQGPGIDDVGLKDTAVATAHTVTRFFITFRPNLLGKYLIDPTKYPGYIHHCHIVEHEDNEMMRPLLMSDTVTVYPNATFPPSDIHFLTSNHTENRNQHQ